MTLPTWNRPRPLATVRRARLVIVEVFEAPADPPNRKPPAPSGMKPVVTTGVVIPFPRRVA